MIPNLPADIRDVEKRGHGLRGVASVRSRDAAGWTNLNVVSGTVTLHEMGSFPGRSCSVKVYLNPGLIDDQGILSVFGSWVKLEHEISVGVSTVYRIPLGYFRVDELVIEPLEGAVTINGTDAGSMVVDYGLVTLDQGEILPGQSYRDRASTMLVDAMGSITPWWTGSIVDNNGLDNTKLAPARIQYEGSRAEAIAALVVPLQRRVAVSVNGTNVFRYVVEPAANAPVVTITPGNLGNLEQLQSTVSRAGVANVATVAFTDTNNTQYRIYREYTGNPLVHPAGQYGRTSVEANAPDAKDTASAIAIADAALGRSTILARDFALNVSPVYGIESGDVVTIVGRNGQTTTARLVGGTIGLTANTGWTFNLRAFTVGPDVEEVT